jgi:hypothetical protein
MEQNSLWGKIQEMMGGHTSGVNTWDWEGGAPSPFTIRTPWLANAWHYDEQGRIVPNDPNSPSAPWNIPGATTTFDDYLASQPSRPTSPLANMLSDPNFVGTVKGTSGTSFQRNPMIPMFEQQSYGQRRSPLEEALRRLQGGM